jgi:hypothetical protein
LDEITVLGIAFLQDGSEDGSDAIGQVGASGWGSARKSSRFVIDGFKN